MQGKYLVIGKMQKKRANFNKIRSMDNRANKQLFAFAFALALYLNGSLTNN